MVLSISARSFIFLKVPVCVYGGGGEVVRVAARVVPTPPLRDTARALSPVPGAQGLRELIRPLLVRSELGLLTQELLSLSKFDLHITDSRRGRSRRR